MLLEQSTWRTVTTRLEPSRPLDRLAILTHGSTLERSTRRV